jgi:stage V sporulation protein AC
MDQSKESQKKYDRMVKEASPNSPLFTNCIKAFCVGGLICAIGQFITNRLLALNFSKEAAGMYTSVALVFASTLLTGLGVYDNIGKFAGAGTAVPITGFANSVAAPAVEFKKEGFILGVGAKIFLVAGPVLLYGSLASAIVGIIYYFVK